MKWSDVFHLTILQYRANRLRHVLCGLAVAVGVFAMLLLSNFGIFAGGQVTELLQGLGLQGMTVYLTNIKNGETLTTAFAEFMEENIPSVDGATPVKFAIGTYKLGQIAGDVTLIGAGANLEQAMTLEFLYGQGFSENGLLDIQNPILISNRLAKTLFSRENVIGKNFYLTVNGKQEQYTVIGVVRDQISLMGGMFGNFIPDLAYIPLHKISSSDAADQILFSAENSAAELSGMLQGVAEDVFRMQSGLTVQNLTGFIEKIEQVTQKIKLFFLAIAGFSMVVAVFAIENSMLSAVQEMREEVLLYRMIGIRRRDIVRVILAQSTGLCLLGAGVGIGMGILVTTGMRLWLLPLFLLMLLAVMVLMRRRVEKIG